MSSRIQKKASSIVAIGIIAGLIALIVLLWCFFAKQGPSLPPATPKPPMITRGIQNVLQKDAEHNLLPSHVSGYEKDVNTELVPLVKVGPKPVKGQDFIYDLQKKNQNSENFTSTPKEHHSGHFRHLHTELWDPHPEYVIEAFGIKLHLFLRHNYIQQRRTALATINNATNHDWSNHGIHITHLFHNRTWREKYKTKNCFYTGSILGEPNESQVVVSLCGGMTGYIRSKEGNFYIEPAEVYQNSSIENPLLHRIHKISSVNSENFEESNIDTCDTRTSITDIDDDNNEIIFDDLISEHTMHTINKRSITAGGETIASYQAKNREYFVEVLVVADKTMYDYHKTNETLIHYILTLMSHVSFLYKDATIGNPINLLIKDILILPDKIFVQRAHNNSGVNSAEMLKNFCAFQNGLRSNSGFNSDVAILLTREKICRNIFLGQCDTLGLAELGSMCSSENSCAIVKDKGLPTSYTIAHELGHVLNMPHDDDLEKCARYNKNDLGVKYIMGRMISNISKPWMWSKCSRKYLTAFLESKLASCLTNHPKREQFDGHWNRQDQQLLQNTLPGEQFSPDKQCALVFAPGLKLCPYMPKCQRLWCTVHEKNDSGCQSQEHPWADGTYCGPNMWCIRGKCLQKDLSLLQPISGGWGPWRRGQQCSRTCGGGVRQVERECDAPRPQNGGAYCVGPGVKYESCNTEPCEEHAEEFREQQCARFNGNSMGIPGLAADVKWVPKYESILPEEHCLLYCRVAHTNQHYLLAEKVVDGTKCGFNSHDLCVGGFCRKGGCDNRLGSNLKLDACGICGGDNSQCEQIDGKYNAKPQYGYSKVVRVPKGSSNLDIRQHGWERDGNYLALVDSETGRYIMNGGHILHAYPTVFMYGGVTLSYTGTDVSIERINSSNSVRLKKDLLVELLSVDKLLPPNITYSYMIVRDFSPMYSWQLYQDSWGPCSRMCSGVQRAKPRCVALENSKIVPDEFCEHLSRENSNSRDCNTHCRLFWKIKKRFPCSSECGPGQQTIVHECVRLENSHLELLDGLTSGHQFLEEGEALDEREVPWAQPVDIQHCSDLKMPPEVEVCEGGCEEVHWKYDDWSECSRSCGTGSQHRTARCVSSSLQALDSAHCLAVGPALTTQPCNTQRCPTWATAEWTACNVSCGRGWRLRPYYCHAEGKVLREEACDFEKMPVWKEECTAAGRPTCQSWDAGQWEPCQDCDTWQHRQVHCRSYSGEIVSSSECKDLLKPNATRKCPPSQCINSVLQSETTEWRSGPWSECSRSCGGGIKSRNVACLDSLTGALVEAERCDPGLRPINRVHCGTHKCPTWNTGDWGECTSDCHRYRLVICQDFSGIILSPNSCLATERPQNSTTCSSHHKCYISPTTQQTVALTTNKQILNIPRYKWKLGPWGACSKSCGRGLRTRSVQCVDITQNATLVDQFCQQKKPKSVKVCHKNDCSHIWVEGPWTLCTKSCGEGMKFRNVTCHKLLSHGRFDSHSRCDAKTRPKSYEKCMVQSCNNNNFSWITGPWKNCTHLCGRKGRQTRHLYCQYAGKKVPKKHCPRNTKPRRKQKCNIKKCHFKNCLEIKTGIKTNQDGDYPIQIGQNEILIYCHKMFTNNPEEFLSLKDDGRENYSEFYEKQLLDPNVCPKNGQRDDKCPCRSDDSGRAGLTVFFKVKLNLTSLKIIPDDFSFSRQIFGEKIPFGTAGDCYSRGECPQGRFAINLSGTGLKISPKVEWKTQGIQPSFTVVKQRNGLSVSGKCGGYCGSCEPEGRSGLMVEPNER